MKVVVHSSIVDLLDKYPKVPPYGFWLAPFSSARGALCDYVMVKDMQHDVNVYNLVEQYPQWFKLPEGINMDDQLHHGSLYAMMFYNKWVRIISSHVYEEVMYEMNKVKITNTKNRRLPGKKIVNVLVEGLKKETPSYRQLQWIKELGEFYKYPVTDQT